MSLLEPFEYAFFRHALLAGLLASIACGVVGSFVVVKRITSISGGLAHAAFGGVGLGYFLGFSPLLGATGFALLSGVVVGVAYQRRRANVDAVISTLWALGMAIGILFVSLAPGFAPDLMSYLFGSILFVPPEYLKLTLVLDGLILLTVALLFREFQAVAFDESFAAVAGVPVGRVLQLLLAMTALAIVTLIQVVGIILLIALLTIPALVARQWADRLVGMMVLATGIGAVCTTLGLFLSYGLSAASLDVPSGPLVILIAIVVYGISSLLVYLRDSRSRRA